MTDEDEMGPLDLPHQVPEAELDALGLMDARQRDELPERQSVKAVMGRGAQIQGHFLQGSADEAVKGATQSVYEIAARSADRVFDEVPFRVVAEALAHSASAERLLRSGSADGNRGGHDASTRAAHRPSVIAQTSHDIAAHQGVVVSEVPSTAEGGAKVWFH